MGLSTKELTQIRETLAGGKRPRVVFTEAAGQIAGQFGHVVQLEDPATHEDWIMVKFGADVLPFPPSDLAIAPRRSGPSAAKKAAPAPPEPEFKVVREAVSPNRSPNRQEKAVPAKPASEPDSAPGSEDKPAPAQRKPATAGAARGKSKPLPSFTITLAYAEGEWTVGAVQGAKSLAKPYLIKPAEALKMVALLDVPGVQEAVEQILAAERAQAEAQADKLRAELAELEAKLAELGPSK